MEKEKTYFIIPKNYKDSAKFLGIIRYSSLTIICVWGSIILLILKLIKINFWVKTYIFMFLFIPIAIIASIDFDNESICSFAKYFYKFHKNKRVYIFNK